MARTGLLGLLGFAAGAAATCLDGGTYAGPAGRIYYPGNGQPYNASEVCFQIVCDEEVTFSWEMFSTRDDDDIDFVYSPPDRSLPFRAGGALSFDQLHDPYILPQRFTGNISLTFIPDPDRYRDGPTDGFSVSFKCAPPIDVVGALRASSDLTILVALLEKAGLVETLQAAESATVFAPTNAVFGAAGVQVDGFVGDAELAKLRQLLLHHVTARAVDSTTQNATLLEMLSGPAVTFINQASIYPRDWRVGNAKVTAFGVRASNGFINTIDGVLSLDKALDDLCYGSYVGGVRSATGTVDYPGDGGFYPLGQKACFRIECNSELDLTWTRFETGGADLVSYYSGSTPLGGFSGGVSTRSLLKRHLGPEPFTVTFTGFYSSDKHGFKFDYACNPPQNIVDKLRFRGFHTFLAAAEKTGLVDYLSASANTATVFAPTDAAFAAAGIDVADFTTDEEVTQLRKILQFHITARVTQDYFTYDPAGGSVNLDMLNGITAAANKRMYPTLPHVRIENAAVVDCFTATNGLVQELDAVMMTTCLETFDGGVYVGGSGTVSFPGSNYSTADTVCLKIECGGGLTLTYKTFDTRGLDITSWIGLPHHAMSGTPTPPVFDLLGSVVIRFAPDSSEPDRAYEGATFDYSCAVGSLPPLLQTGSVTPPQRGGSSSSPLMFYAAGGLGVLFVVGAAAMMLRRRQKGAADGKHDVYDAL